MSASSEDVMLRRFVTTGDANAFSQIVRSHAGLVYGVCLRVLGDKEKAADATQETFFQLLRGAGQIKASVPAWLHKVATRKAVDMIRSDSSRQRTEAEYAERKICHAETWHDLAPHVDQALNALDEETRDLLVQYYFENRSMADIASEKGISHPTVSRRVEAGRSQLREEFRKKGIVVAAAALGSLLTENAAQAAPAAVVSELAKIALVGANSASVSASSALSVAGSNAARTTVSAFAATAKTKLIVAIAVGAVAVTGTVIYKQSTDGSGKIASKPDRIQMSSRKSPDVPTSGRVVPVSPTVESRPEQSSEPVAQESPSAADSQLVSEPTSTLLGAGIEAVAPEQPAPVSQQAANQQPANRFDLSTPAATVQTFVKMFTSGDAESVMACFLPGGTDYEDIQEILYAGPDDSEYEMKVWFESLDPDAEMPVTMRPESPSGIGVAWLVTFKRDFTMKGHLFPAGSQMELDATLVERGGKWLIDGI